MVCTLIVVLCLGATLVYVAATGRLGKALSPASVSASLSVATRVGIEAQPKTGRAQRPSVRFPGARSRRELTNRRHQGIEEAPPSSRRLPRLPFRKALNQILPRHPVPGKSAVVPAYVAARFTKHFGAVNSISVTRNGQIALSAGDDHSVWLWQVKDGQQIARFAHPSPVLDATISPDGRFALTATKGSTNSNGALRVWDCIPAPTNQSLARTNRI